MLCSKIEKIADINNGKTVVQIRITQTCTWAERKTGTNELIMKPSDG